MTKIALLSDIHANVHALKAVLRDVRESGASEIAFGGDIVGYGAHPSECLNLVRKLGGHCVFGNHDQLTKALAAADSDSIEEALHADSVSAGVAYAVLNVEREALEWLWERPWLLPLEGAVLAHASLHTPERWPYLVDDEDALPTLEILKEKDLGIGFFGHTHKEKVFVHPDSPAAPGRIDETKLHLPAGVICAITIGSVGQPRDPGDLRAAWATWDPEERVVEFHRTDYPAVEAAKAILDADLPFQSALRLLHSAHDRNQLLLHVQP